MSCSSSPCSRGSVDSLTVPSISPSACSISRYQICSGASRLSYAKREPPSSRREKLSVFSVSADVGSSSCMGRLSICSSGNTMVCGTSDRISCEEHPVRRTVMRIPANIFFISRILFPLHTLLFSDQFLPNSVSTSPLLRSRVIPILQEFTNRSKGLPFISLTFFISEVPDSLARSISSLFSIQRICS